MMKVEDAIKYVNEEIALRDPNEKKVEEYSEKMEQGVKFPAIVIGRWPKTEKYGDSGIVDGLHRVNAAKRAKMGSIEHTFMDFKSIADALTYMYVANSSHGLPPTEGQRNERIKLVKKMDPNLTLEKMADTFKLGKSSIDRILKGEQGEGKSGRKTGTKASKAHNSLEVLKGSAFYKIMDRLDYSLSRVRPVAEYVAFVTPEGEDGIELNKTAVDTLKRVHNLLGNLIGEIAKVK